MKLRTFSVTAKQVRYTDSRGAINITRFATETSKRMPQNLLGRYEVPEKWFKGRASYSIDGQSFNDQLAEWMALGYKVK